MNRTLFATSLLASSTLATVAHAQCPPGSWFCADITIGNPVPPPVYIVPQPQPVYVQPPPVVYVQPPPPPPVVVYQPAPPPRVYYQPAQYVPMAPPPAQRNAYAGLAFSIPVSALSGTRWLSGASAALRLRGRGALGAEIALDALGGRDFNGDSRFEMPLSVSGLVYFNPQSRFQVYGLVGFNTSYAAINYTEQNAADRGLTHAGYWYAGGQLGIGAELQLSQHWSLFGDVRGFIRGRVDDTRDVNPEFVRATDTGGYQASNLSVGTVGRFGAVVYF